MNLDEVDADQGYPLRLTSRLGAEPHVLAAWSRDTRHPRLQEAYQALMEHVTPRAATMALALVEELGLPRRNVTDAVHEETESATAIRFEPSRLKWLLANRRDRLAHDRLPGYQEQRDAEQAEAEELESLLAQVLATMC